jgi:hypothetical protein
MIHGYVMYQREYRVFSINKYLSIVGRRSLPSSIVLMKETKQMTSFVVKGETKGSF